MTGENCFVGPKPARQFQDVIQVDFIGQPKMADNGLEYAGWLGNLNSLSQDVTPKSKAQAFGRIYSHWDMEGPSSVAATITPYGKGQIAAIYMNIGSGYDPTPVIRDFVDA
jgi:hypothetical protein